MSIEVDSVDLNDPSLEWSSCSFSENDRDFHGKIFTNYSDCVSLTKSVALPMIPTINEQKVQKVARDRKIAAMDTNVSAEATMTVEWGGKDGTSVSGSVSGSVSDDKGNKVEAEVTVKEDGSGSATVSVEKKSGS